MSHIARFLDPALLERLNQLELSARRVVEGQSAGLHRSPLRGASVEFRQHRAYSPGDELRRLDWRVLARTDRPYVREFQEETNLRAVIMLDRSGSMSYGREFGSKYDYARRIVAALAYLLVRRAESVGLAIFGQQLDHWLAPQTHSAQLSRVMEMLEHGEPSGLGAAHTALQQVADRLGRRALVLLLSDLFVPVEKLRAGLARLRHDRHEVVVIQVLDPDEQNFPFTGFARFRGLEDEPASLRDAALLRRDYLERFRAHCAGVERTCHMLRVELARFMIDRPLDDALIWFLRRRAVRT